MIEQAFVMNILYNFALFLIVTISLNLEVGYAGIPQFGRVLAVITGAIVAGAVPGRILSAMIGGPVWGEYAHHLLNFPLVDKLNRTLLATNPVLSFAMFILTIALAAIMGGLVGYLCSLPAIRLKEAYLGITLLAFGDILRIIAWNWDPLVGATEGINVPNFLSWAGEPKFINATIVLLVFAIAVFIYVEILAKSPYGRVLKAMRDSPVASGVYGKDIVKFRAYTLVIGGALAGIAGALYAIYVGVMNASAYTRLTWTFWPWAFMMLGGTGNNVGVLIGVLLFSIIRTTIYTYKTEVAAYTGISPAWLEYILVGLVIIIIPLIRPQGILPEKPAFTINKNKIKVLKESVLEE